MNYLENIMSQNNLYINANPDNPNNLNSSLGSKNFQNSPYLIGSLKTEVGDIAISMENLPELSIDINAYVSMFLNSNLNENNFVFLSGNHNIIFISPESVEIEIEIKDLLSDLQKLDSLTTNSNPETESLFFDSSVSSKTKTSSHLLPPFLNSSKNPNKQSMSANEITKTSASNTSNFSIEKNNLNQEVNFFEKKQSSIRKDESIRINVESNFLNKEEKITPSFKQEKQEKEQQQQKQQEKEQKQQEKEQEQKQSQYQKKEKKVLKCNEINVNSISIEELRYHNSLKQLKKNKEVSSCLKKKLDSPIKVFNASLSNKKIQHNTTQKVHIENIFIKFMQLMAKILGQAEAEAHELYLKIKERTDNVDLLTLLLSKVNSEKEDINWEDNEEMKFLINKARSCGVDIPPEKYSWTEEEKKLLKENIQMKKDSMEKITQLERTDMQRYLQEVSQCHQTRSNVLKLLKEVIDTFIYNLRP